MSMSRLWLFLAVALPALAAVMAPMSSVDLTYQLRAGGAILDSRSIPTVDSWTFLAAGATWVDQQWGAQALLAVVFRAAGWTGLVLLRVVLTAIVVGATLAIVRRRDLDPRVATILTLLAFVIAAPAMGLRPQLFGMACFAITLLLTVGRREQPRAFWLVPVVAAVWANLHGSFFLAPLIVGLAWIEDVYDRDGGARRTLLVGAATVLAACLTPFGPAAWAYAIGLSTNSGVTARTTEWQPTSLRDASGFLFFASIAAVVAVITRSGRRVPWPTLLWLGVFAAIGTVAQRGIAWWPLVAVAVVSGMLSDVGARRPISQGSRPFNAVVAGLVVVTAIVLLPFWRPVDPKTGVPVAVLTDAPPGITDALRSTIRPGDRILNPQRWGSWFEYAVPGALVAVDSRIELFSAQRWDAYEAVVVGLEGWRETLASWHVTVAVVDASDGGLRDRLTALGWTTTHKDGDGSVLVAPAQ